MDKFIDAVIDGLDLAYSAARMVLCIGGSFLVFDLARLAAKYTELITYALHGPTKF